MFGDNRPGKGEPQPETLGEIVAKIHAMDPRPAFAVSLGDIIEGKDPEQPTSVIEGQFDDFLERVGKAGVPIFNAPGNHEMDDDHDVPSERMHAIYERTVAPFYGAFDYGNSRFILLNTENVPPKGAPPPEPPQEFSYMAAAQIAELKADLEANKDKTRVFIAMHYPMKPQKPRNSLNPTDLQALSELFAEYDNISYVLAAHEHLYFNPQDPEKVTEAPRYEAGETRTQYLVSGGAGAPALAVALPPLPGVRGGRRRGTPAAGQAPAARRWFIAAAPASRTNCSNPRRIVSLGGGIVQVGNTFQSG